MDRSLRGSLLLLITSVIWGFSFVAQVSGMDNVEPFTFNFSRNMVSGVFLIGAMAMLPKITDSKRKESEQEKKTLIQGGVACGTVLFLAMSLQQFGVMYTTAGKAGFITALYILLVPIFGIFLGKKVTPKIWLAVLIAVVGLYLLSFTKAAGPVMGKGDFLVLLCAIAYAGHILIIDHFSPQVNGVKMSCIQFFVAGVLSMVAMLFTEHFQWADVVAAAIPILFAGVMSSGVGYTFQIIAQKDTDPTVASLIMSLESVFAVIGGALLLSERLTGRELLGCIIMFVAIILAQLPDRRKKKTA